MRDNEVHIPGFDMLEKIVETAREKGEGVGGRLLNKALFEEASPPGPVSYPLYILFGKRYPFRVSSIEK